VITSAANVVLSVANTQLTGTITNAQLGTDAVSNTKIAAGAVEQYFADTDYEAQFRNRIINGDMRIDQRNAGASVNNAAGSLYTLDRWGTFGSQASKFSVQQNAGSVTPPVGFTNYLGVTSSSAYTVGASEQFSVVQPIEGLNISDLGWGTANAKTVTISFWVRSSLTGTFGGSLRNSGVGRSYPFTYSISVADTWEYKTVTISGDTSGTWLTTNGIGVYVAFALGAGASASNTAGSWAAGNYPSATGATSVVGTNGATFYVTGVQFEVGSVATPFERRPFGAELALCQRYYYQMKATGVSYPFGFGQCYSTTLAGVLIPYPVTMRVAPSALEQSGTAAHYRIYSASGNGLDCSVVPAYASILTTPSIAAVNFTVTSGLTSGDATQAASANSSAYLGWSAEL
jgi:hypothetical protein